jgi:hypothetical protein
MARRKRLLDAKLADQDYCYITTAGRVSGKPHTFEIWFGAWGDTIYVLAGNGHRADFVKNAKKKPSIDVSIGETKFTGQARVVGDATEDAFARRLLLEKYAPPRYEGDLSEWGRDALPFAVDLDARVYCVHQRPACFTLARTPAELCTTTGRAVAGGRPS